jgi:outer membrane protein assembly factor BamB
MPSTAVIHTLKEFSGVDPIWNIRDAYLQINMLDITLDASMGKTCFLGGLGVSDVYKDLVCLDSQSGKVLWNKETWPSAVFAVTLGGIYVSYNIPAKVVKYDLQSGNIVWEKPFGQFVSGPTYLYFINDQVHVLTADDNFFVLDTYGNVIKAISGKRILISTPDETFVNESGLKVFNTKTNDILWEYIDPRLLYAPLFTTDKIFVNGGYDSRQVYALDRKTGTFLWRSNSTIIGGLAYSPDKHLIYALSEDGNLLAINENNGQENLLARFTPIPFILDGPQVSSYQIAYDQKTHTIIVALGDSHQIFAFQEK